MPSPRSIYSGHGSITPASASAWAAPLVHDTLALRGLEALMRVLTEGVSPHPVAAVHRLFDGIWGNTGLLPGNGCLHLALLPALK